LRPNPAPADPAPTGSDGQSQTRMRSADGWKIACAHASFGV
jgi:hypothetical protein